MSAQLFLIIIPAFNEEESMGSVLSGLLDAKLAADILVVNDGSRDRTAEVAMQYPVTIITHPVNLGYGSALQTGYKYATDKGYPFILQFDSDGQHHPNDLPQIMYELQKGNVDIVLGSRFLEKSSRFHMGLVKRIGIHFFRLLIRKLTGTPITDPTSGLRGVSSRVFNFYSIRDRFPADFPDADILIQQLLMKYRVKEVPAQMREREAGVSMHAGLRPVFYMLQIILSIGIVIIRHKFIKKVT